jgi:hypothetical protein
MKWFQNLIFSLIFETLCQKSYPLVVLEELSSSSSCSEELITFSQLSSAHSWAEFGSQSLPKKENVAKSFLFVLALPGLSI